MTKSITVAGPQTRIFTPKKYTVGLDLGDRWSWYYVLDERGEVVFEHKLSTTLKAVREVFGAIPESRVALETGTHSPWISRLLKELGHEVIVAQARKVRLIGESRKMRAPWRGWRASIPSCWDRFSIAVPRHKRI
jgi:transposase